MKTAIEWLAAQLSLNDRAKYNGLIEQAKQMEKDQLEDAYDRHKWRFLGINSINGEVTKQYVPFGQYYTETYKNTNE